MKVLTTLRGILLRRQAGNHGLWNGEDKGRKQVTKTGVTFYVHGDPLHNSTKPVEVRLQLSLELKQPMFSLDRRNGKTTQV